MENLKKFRMRQGLSLDKMARKIEVSFSFYQKVEQGHAQPSRGFMQKLKKAFPEASIDEIFFSEIDTKAV